MSSTSVSVDSRDQFRVRDARYGTPSGEPVTDDSHIYIEIGDADFNNTTAIWLTVGQWRALAAAVDTGIEQLPAERQKREAREVEIAARRAKREAVSA